MKTILTRINLDIKEEDFTKALRFHVAVSLIKSLSTKRNKLVILSHFGRPTRYEKTLSLRRFVEPLSRGIGKDIIFLGELDINILRTKIEKAEKGSVFILENLRFHKGETANSKEFSKALASLGDVFINNDFATSHHESASLVGITEFIKSKPGELIKKEIKALNRIKKKAKHPFVLIIGGSKAKDKISTIENLLGRVDKVLLGGVVANTFYKAHGMDIKDSLYESNLLGDLPQSEKIIIPTDYRIENNMFLDIGENTVKKYVEIIKTAKTIAWSGPMGYFEKEQFAKGTEAIAKAVLANKNAYVVIGGAQTFASLPIEVIKQENGKLFLSTGGGAMLHYLAGKKLPALEALHIK